LGIESEGRRPFSFVTRNYLVLTLTSALWNVGFSVTGTYFPLYVFELGGSETAIGIIFALESVGYALSLIVGGQISDMYGRKRLLGLMTLASGVSHLLLAVAPHWQALALASVVVNLCWVMEPAFWAMLADSIDERRRGVAFSVFSCVNFLPWVVMPYVGGYLIDIVGVLTAMRWMYVALATLGVAAGILRLSMLEETLTPPCGSDRSSMGLKDAGRIMKDALKEHLRTWFSMPSSTFALAATYMIWSFEFGLVEPYWIVYAEEEIGLVPSQWGVIIAVGNVISLLMKSLVVGWVLDRFGRRSVLLAVLAFDTSTYLLFILCRDFVHVLLMWAYASVVWSFYEATYSSIEADMVPKERRGRTYAAFGVAWSVFSIPASLVGGVIYEKVSHQLSFILAAVVVIVCLTVTSKFVHPPEAKGMKRAERGPHGDNT